MATVSTFTCPPAAQLADGDCVSGQGSWHQVQLMEPWDVSQLNSSELASAMAAGFTVMGILLASIWAGKTLLKAIR